MLPSAGDVSQKKAIYLLGIARIDNSYYKLVLAGFYLFPGIECKGEKGTLVPAEVLPVQPRLSIIVGPAEVYSQVIKAPWVGHVKRAPVPNDAIIAGKSQLQRVGQLLLHRTGAGSTAVPPGIFADVVGVPYDFPGSGKIEGPCGSCIQSLVQGKSSAGFIRWGIKIRQQVCRAERTEVLASQLKWNK